MATPPGKPRARKPAAPTTPDPIEMAMEAEAKDASPDSPARRVLLRQEALIAEQVRLTRAERRNQNFGSALKVLTGLAGLAAAAALGVLVLDASKATGVVIEPFVVPADLAARGLTGEVVAVQVLDELRAMQAASARAGSRAFQANTGQQIRVAIPSTGINLGDLRTALRAWLGSEIYVTGEVYRQDGGVVMRARATGGDTVIAAGSENDLGPLASGAAKAVYRQTQPDGYAWWLVSQEGDGARLAAAQVDIDAADRAPDAKSRAYLLTQASNWMQAIDLDRALALVLEAQDLDPDLAYAHTQSSVYHGSLGHTEASLRDRMRGASDDRDGQAPALPAQSRLFRALFIRDLARASSLIEATESDLRTSRYLGTQIDVLAARVLTGLHDFSGAFERLDHPRNLYDLNGPADLRRLETWRPIVIQAAGDWPTLAAMDPMMPEAALPTESARRIRSSAFLAIAEARAITGDLGGARELINQTPLDCDRCILSRARIAEAAGERRTAEYWYGEADKMFPTLPDAVQAWGEARVRMGDFEGALTPLREARKRAPRWADPLKYQGDALAGLARHKQALGKYKAAARHAPKWGGLYLSWGEALNALGRTEDARAKWRTAQGLDLTPDERARLTRNLAGETR